MEFMRHQTKAKEDKYKKYKNRLSKNILLQLTVAKISKEH